METAPQMPIPKGDPSESREKMPQTRILLLQTSVHGEGITGQKFLQVPVGFDVQKAKEEFDATWVANDSEIYYANSKRQEGFADSLLERGLAQEVEMVKIDEDGS
jgi:hypothetical protein